MSVTADRSGKITKSHSTMTETAADVANCAIKLDAVTKISLGQITHVGGGRKGLKFSPMRAGIVAKVRGSGAIQILRIYTNQPDEVSRILMQGFQ